MGRATNDGRKVAAPGYAGGAALLGLALLCAGAPLPVRGQQEAGAPPAPSAAPGEEASVSSQAPSRRPSRLQEVFPALREMRHKDAARILRSIDRRTLEPDEARRWRQLASLTALRLGDAAWLREINDDPEHYPASLNLMLITAQRMLQDANYAGARALLGQIAEPEKLDEVPRRRYLQLYARLEQLTGNTDRERGYVAKLVDFAGKWPGPMCQGCHADPKRYGDATTMIDLSEWWVGERFTALLRARGDARAVRERAEARLRKDPNDASARLRVAYALRAEGRSAEAEALLRALPWAAFPDREHRKPLQLATFP